MEDTNKDGTEQVQELNASDGQVSPDNEGLSDEKPKVFTEEEHKTLMSKEHSTLDKRITTLEKELKVANNTKAENATLRTQLAEAHRQRDAEDLESAKDDPELLDIIKREQKVRDRELEIGSLAGIVDILKSHGFETEEQVTAFLERTNEADRRELAQELTTEFKDVFTVQDLLDLGADSPELMRKHAETLAKKLAATKTAEKPPEKVPDKKVLKPDSGIGQGAGVDTTGMSPRDMIKMGLTQK